MALRDISLNIGVEGVDQATQGMKRVEGSLDSMGRKTQTATQQMEAAFARVNSALMTLGVGFTAAGIIREIYRAIEAIDSLRTSTIQIAAIITTMQGPKNVAEHYAQASKYAEVLAKKLQEVDAKSFANYDTLMKMVNVMAQQGVIMDVNNKKQVDAFTSLSNAVAMYTTGQNQAIQANQEIRALMSGQATQGSQLALQIDSMAKSSGLYKGGLKEIVELGRKHGDTLERMEPFLVGINAASGDIEKTWGAVRSSAETAKNMIQRAGFDDLYKNIIKTVGGFVATLKNNADEIGSIIKGVMATMATATKIAVVYFAVFVGAPAVLSAATIALQRFQVQMALASVEMAGATVAGRAWAIVFGTQTVTAALAAASAMGKLRIAGSLMFAAFAGWEIGKLLYDKFDVVKKFSIALVGGILKLIAEVKYAYLELVEVGKGAWDWVKGNGYTGDAKVRELIKTHADAKAKIDVYMDEELAKLNKRTATGKVDTPVIKVKTDDPHADTVRKATAAATAAERLKESWLDTARTLQAKIDMSTMDEVGDKFRKAQLEADNLRDKYKPLPPVLRDAAYAMIDTAFAATDAATWTEVLAKREEEYVKQSKEETDALQKVKDAYRGLQEKMDPVIEAENRRAEAVRILTEAHNNGLNPALADSIKIYDEYIKKQNEVQTIIPQVPLADLTKSTFAGNSFSNSQANDYGKTTSALEEMNKMYALQAAAVADLDARKRAANAVEAKTVMAIYQKKRELGQLDKIQSLQTMQHVQDQLGAYRTLFGTTGQLFKEGSRGRRIMHDLEMAATLAEIGVQMQKNLVIVAGYFTKSQSAVASAAIENAANASTAVTGAVSTVANTATSGDGYTAFARIAAMISVMAGVLSMAGIAFGGGGSGGGSASQVSPGSFGPGAGGAIGSPVTSIHDSQTAASLSRLAASADNASLAIGRVADGLTKIGDLFGPGGYMALASGGAPNIGAKLSSSGGIIQSVMSGIFGGGWKTTSGGVSLGLSATDVSARDYIDEKKKGGLFSRNKYRTSYSDDPAFAGVMQSAITRIVSQITRSNAVMGTSYDFSGVSLPETKIATAGRKAEDIAKDLQVWLETASNALAKTTAGLQQFAFYGENAFDALVRLSTSLQGVNEKLEMIGHTLVTSTLAGANAAWKLADAFGGLDKMQEAVDKYFTTMFTQAEQDALKASQAGRQVSVAFAEMGLAAPLTREAFRRMVGVMDVTTGQGAALFKALMDIVPAFDTFIGQIEKTRDKLITTWSDQALETAKKMLDVAKQGADFYRQSSRTLTDALTSLRGGDLSTLSLEQKYLEARASFAKTANLAKAGDRDSLTALPGLATAFATASKAVSPDRLAYTADVARITDVLATTSAASSALGSAADYQATLLTNQVALLEAIKEEQAKGVDANIQALQELSAAIAFNSQSVLDSAKLTAAGITGSMATAVNAYTGQAAIFTAAAAAGPTGWLTAKGALVSTSTATAALNAATSTGLGNTGAVATAINKTNEVVLPAQFLKMMQTSVEATKGLITYYQAKAVYDTTIEALGKKTIESPIDYAVSQVGRMAAGTAVYDSKYDLNNDRLINAIDTNMFGAIQSGWALSPTSAGYMAYFAKEKIKADATLAGLGTTLYTQDKLNADLKAAKDKYNSTINSIFTTLPSYDVGTPYVSSDQTANIHRGEMIFDRQSSDILRKYGIPTGQANDNREIIAELRELRREVAELRNEQKAGSTAIAQNTQATAKQLSRWDGDGTPPVRSATA